MLIKRIRRLLGPKGEKDQEPIPQKPDVAPAFTLILNHFFLDINLQKAAKIPRNEKFKRRTRVAINEFGAVTRILEHLLAVTKSKTAEGLRIELRLANTEADLLANINLYLPLFSNTLEFLEIPISKNSVYEHVHKGEEIHKAAKISISALVSHLMRLHHLPQDSIPIPAPAHTEVSVHILGTALDGVPQSLIFLVNGTNGVSESTLNKQRRTQNRPPINRALAPA